MVMVFLMMKVLQCLRTMEDVDIFLLRPFTLPLEIKEFIIVVKMVVVDLSLKRPSTLSIAIVEFIILVLMVEVGLCLKRPDTIYFAAMEQEFMLMGELGIGLIPATIPPITEVDVADC